MNMEVVPWTLPTGIDFAHSTADRKVLRRMSKQYTAQPPDCLFLSKLPAELLNLVYEFVAANCLSLEFRGDRISAPALGCACRNTHLQCSYIFVHQAPKYATAFKLHLVDFQPGVARAAVRHLPPPAAPGLLRRFTTINTLTNNCVWWSADHLFRSNLEAIDWDKDQKVQPPFWEKPRAAITGLDGGEIVSDLHFRWDVKTFDVAFMRRRMEMFRNCENARQDRVYEALEEAVKRYDSEAPGARRSKKTADSTK